MKRHPYIFCFVFLLGEMSHAHAPVRDSHDLSGCEQAVSTAAEYDIPLKDFVSDLASLNIYSTIDFMNFIKKYPDMLPSKPLEIYPELKGKWSILWNMVKQHFANPEQSNQKTTPQTQKPMTLEEIKIALQQAHYELSMEEFNKRKKTAVRTAMRPKKGGENTTQKPPLSDNNGDNNQSTSAQYVEDQSPVTHNVDISTLEQEISALLKIDKFLTIHDLSRETEQSLYFVKKALKNLQDNGQLQYIKAGRNGYWLFTEDRDKPIDYDPIRQEKENFILSLFKYNPQMKIREVVKQTAIPRSSLYLILDKLQEEERLKRIGNNNNGYWQVKGTSRDPHREREAEVSALLKKHPKWTVPKLAEETKLPIHAVRQIIKRLKQRGELYRTGIGIHVRWIVPTLDSHNNDIPTEKDSPGLK